MNLVNSAVSDWLSEITNYKYTVYGQFIKKMLSSNEGLMLNYTNTCITNYATHTTFCEIYQ